MIESVPRKVSQYKMVDGICFQEEASNSNGAPTNNNNNNKGGSGSGSRVKNAVLKALCVAGVAGGIFLITKFTQPTTRLDHTRIVAEALCGEKSSSEQSAWHPMTYFNLRMLTCPATTIVNGSRVLYFEQAFWRTPEKPYRQRFLVVKPCPKEMKCDVEVASFAVKEIEEYQNFCERPKSQRLHAQKVIEDIGEHLNTVYMSKCEKGRRCLYQGSTPPGGFPNSWNGATHCTSELTIYRNGEIHCWDRAYDDERNQVWGVREGPYEFKAASTTTLKL